MQELQRIKIMVTLKEEQADIITIGPKNMPAISIKTTIRRFIRTAVAMVV
jgi:hypothetical protein